MALRDKHKNELKNKYKIKVMGEELVIVGDLSEKYVEKLSNHINVVGKEISRAYPRLSRQRILGLAIMNITDEYYKLKDVYNKKVEDLKKMEESKEVLEKEYKELKNDYEELMTLLEEDDNV